MKRIIAVLVVVSIVIAFSLTTLAAGNEDKSQSRFGNSISILLEKQQKISDKTAENEAKREEFKTKKEEFTAFKTALFEKREQMLANKKVDITLTQENNQLRSDIANSHKAIKESGVKLSNETIAKFKDYNAQIKAILTGMKETNGNIKDILTQNKGFVKEKDYKSMNVAFEKIYTIQQWRNDELKKINGILQEMIKLMASEV